MTRIACLVLLLFSAVTATAQKDDIFSSCKARFPDDPAVYLDRSSVTTITIEGDSLKVYTDNTEDILHLKDQSDGYALNRVYGSSFNEVKDIRAKTLVWDKNRYREMSVSDFKKASDRDDGIFYDDSYFYSFNFPSIALGNRTQLQYRDVMKEPRFMSGFVFSSYIPQVKGSYIIKAPRGVELSYTVMNDAKNEVRFRKTEKGNVVTYEWSVENLPARRNEERDPALRYTAPHLVCHIKSYETKKGRVSVLSDLNDLYRWYYTFVKDLNKTNSAELLAVVEDLRRKSANELELVRNTFYWVQTHIHYVAFEQGMRGFIPHDGSYVCEKRYGDCKDMANLLVNMLSSAGVKVYHTWIGTRDLPYRYTQVPTPLVDNHMIATYIGQDGRYYFLDATSDHTPFGFPSSMIQGKEALIGFDDKRFEVKEVPVVPMNDNRMTDSSRLTLVNNVLVGKGTSTLNGFSKVFGGYRLDRSNEDDVRKYVTRLLSKGNNKFVIDSYKVENLDDRDRPTVIDYSFRISDYHQVVGAEIFINLNLNKDSYNAFINMDLRKLPYENDYQYVKSEVVEFEVPVGFTVEYLPPDFSWDNGRFGCTLAYEQQGNRVILRKRFFLNYLILQVNEFAEWNAAVKKFSGAYKESVILSKTKEN